MKAYNPLIDVVADEVITDADYLRNMPTYTQICVDHHEYKITTLPTGVYIVTVNGLNRGAYWCIEDAEARVLQLRLDYMQYLRTPAPTVRELAEQKAICEPEGWLIDEDCLDESIEGLERILR